MNGSSGLDTNDGYSWTTAKLTIQNATGTVSSNGVVTIADGVYSGYGNTNITINHNMTIQGLSQTGTVIDGSGTNWIFTITSGVNVTFCNLTFTNATGYRGGAIYNHGDTTVKDCTFTNNTATNPDMLGGGGGAICNFADEGNVTSTVSNCIFNFNNGYRGSAIMNYCVNDDYVISTITNCIFTNNTAGFSGTVYNIADTGYVINTVNNCTFTNNTATGNGGAIANFCRYSGLITATVTNSTFNSNHASSGGVIAIWLNDGVINFTATNSIFTNNTAQIGGVVYCPKWNGGSINSTFHFNRFVGNTASAGSAIYRDYGSVNATLNWWGTNLDPTTVTNLIVGTVDANPWVILTVNATPSTINNGETSAITADLNHINGGGDLVGGHIPDGSITLNIPWGSFTNSGTSHSLTGNTVAGAMSATFYASEGQLNPSYNPVQVTATADEYTTTNTESAYIYINPVAYLNITKTANVTNANVGDIIQYNITITNNGPNTASNLIVTDTLPAGLDFVSCTGGGVWDPVTRTVTWPSAVVLNGANVTYYLTALVNSTSLAGTNVTNALNETHAEYPGNSTANCTVYVPKADLYIQITSDKNNPMVGEKFTLTYKLGNNGPDDATNVTIIIPLPDGFVISSISGDGNWTVTGNTITWTMNNVTVGDPYLYITGWTTRLGNYLFTASITSDTFNINSRGISSLTLNAQPTVNAATTTSGNTVGMQSTGAPVMPLALAVLSVLGGLVATRKKQ